jgi:two-component system chemotaxis response regulator CheY
MADDEFADVRILLIEDEMFIRSVTARMLKGLGFKEIVQARNGQEGIELISVAAQPIDVVLCDLKMPVMDGFEFITALRSLPKSKIAKTPVVALTAKSDVDSVQRVRDLGVAGYIVKPASIRAIAERVRSALQRQGKPSAGETAT